MNLILIENRRSFPQEQIVVCERMSLTINNQWENPKHSNRRCWSICRTMLSESWEPMISAVVLDGHWDRSVRSHHRKKTVGCLCVCHKITTRERRIPCCNGRRKAGSQWYVWLTELLVVVREDPPALNQGRHIQATMRPTMKQKGFVFFLGSSFEDMWFLRNAQ